MKKDEFKVGDTVYCVIFGKGKIIDKTYNIYNVYPLKVEFENGIKYTYTQDGKSIATSNRTLFFEEIPIPESAYIRPRWRAEDPEHYYFMAGTGLVAVQKDFGSFENDKHFETGNYFKTEEEAKESKFYKVFHEEE